MLGICPHEDMRFMKAEPRGISQGYHFEFFECGECNKQYDLFAVFNDGTILYVRPQPHDYIDIAKSEIFSFSFTQLEGIKAIETKIKLDKIIFSK